MKSAVFIEVLPGAKDDVVNLLKQYGLYESGCNIAKFFEINGLPEDYRIAAGKKYKLPILLVRYDGKSIRTTLDITDWKKAVRIRDFNLDARKQKLRDDDFIATKKLWVPWHEAVPCEEYAHLPISGSLEEESAASGNRTYPIFGPKYEKTPLKSTKLKGKVFYIVSGHGGPDVGAQGKRAGHTLCEDEYAYDVSLRFTRLLVSHGATAYLIVRDPNDGIRDEDYLPCDKDEYVWGDRKIPLDQKERLKQRTDLINELTRRYEKAGIKDQTVIEIHVDSRSKSQRTDVFFYFRPGSQPSEELATRFHQTFLKKYLKVRASKRYNGTVSGRYLFTLKETVTPVAIYVELANIRNDWDQQRLVITSNRQALANWMLEAVLSR